MRAKSYHFGPEGLILAAKTIEPFVARAIRLYEREPGEADASARLGSYVRRWFGWAGAGLTVVIFWEYRTASQEPRSKTILKLRAI